MLRLPPFRLFQPTSLDEAARVLAGEGPGARVVAGGTDLWPNLKRGHQKATAVVSLAGVAGLAGIRANGQVELGATTPLTDVERHAEVRRRHPALARAVASISSPVLRNMGTIGGNVCLDTRCTYYDQSEEWRRSIHYCTAPMLVALGARVRLVSASGEREVPIAALYRDDGIDYLAKRPEEIVTAILLPPDSEAPGLRTAFFKLRRRGSIDYGVLSVAVALRLDGEIVREARVVLGSIASFPSPAEEVSRALVGERLTGETIRAAAALARGAATPMDNTDFDPRWRGQVTPVFVERTLAEAADTD